MAGLPDPPPARLSETGCFASLDPLEPGDDLIPYQVVSPLWTDGAHKERFVVLPPGETIDFTPSGAWDLPLGAVLVKVFAMDFVEGDPTSRRVLETRFMVRREGGWSFYSYRWNDEGTEAELLGDGGMIAELEIEAADGGTLAVSYTYPSREGCRTCHSEGVGVVLGPRTVQTNLMLRYGDRALSQLEALQEIGAIDPSIAMDPDSLPSMPDPADESQPLLIRAKAYLHANCSHCHQPGGWTSPEADQDLRYEVPFAEQNVCAVPVAYDLVTGADYRIYPGDPERSSIWRRQLVEGVAEPAQMPPVGRSTVDPLGRELLREFILSLEECPPAP